MGETVACWLSFSLVECVRPRSVFQGPSWQLLPSSSSYHRRNFSSKHQQLVVLQKFLLFFSGKRLHCAPPPLHCNSQIYKAGKCIFGGPFSLSLLFPTLLFPQNGEYEKWDIFENSRERNSFPWSHLATLFHEYMYMGKQRPLLLIPFDLCFCFCLCLRRFEMEKERRVDRERGPYIILRIQNQPAFVSFPICAPGLKFPFHHLAALKFVENGKTFFCFSHFSLLFCGKARWVLNHLYLFPSHLVCVFCTSGWETDSDSAKGIDSSHQKYSFRFPYLFSPFSCSFFDFAGKSLLSHFYLRP